MIKPSKEKQIYFAKYIFVMLSSIIITTTNATENGPHNEIKLADFGVNNAWQFSIYNIMIDRVLLAS